MRYVFFITQVQMCHMVGWSKMHLYGRGMTVTIKHRLLKLYIFLLSQVKI